MAFLSRREGRATRLCAAVLALALTAAPAGAADVGDQAPALVLPAADGAPMVLADLRGRVVVVDFWASWCAPCRQALPALDALARRYRTRALDVLAVNVDRRRPQATAFLAAYVPDPALRVLFDPKRTVMARYRPEGMPSIYVIDQEGRIAWRASGGDRVAAELEATVLRLLAASES
jgi:thiol-disulfide isomerase/thioredoxin